jgi:F0F1-type ATP synthase gamma subunit
MSLNNLKKKITAYQSTKKVTKAMQNIAAVKVTKIKHKTLLTKANLKHLEYLYPNPPINIIASNNFHIIFSPKKGLCGGLPRRMLGDIEINTNHTLILAELPLAKLLSEKGHRIDSCFTDLDDNNYPIIDIFNYLKDLKQANILITFAANINHTYALNNISFFYSGDEASSILLYSHLEHAYYETRLCEEQKRIEAMQTASDNCKSLLESTQLKYFKQRQAKITAEILEISNQ